MAACVVCVYGGGVVLPTLLKAKDCCRDIFCSWCRLVCCRRSESRCSSFLLATVDRYTPLEMLYVQQLCMPSMPIPTRTRTKPSRIRRLPNQSSGFPSGHLMPYRLVAGPLLRLSPAGGGGGGGGGTASGPAAGSVSQGVGVPHEERRRFLVLYEIVASEGSDRPPPPNRGGSGWVQAGIGAYLHLSWCTVYCAADGV